MASMTTPPPLPPLPHFRADEFHPHVLVVRLVDAEAHIAAARADERRKALHEAETLLRQRLDAAKQTHNFSGGSYSEGMRDAYDVAVLDIGSMIDRKEPTK